MTIEILYPELTNIFGDSANVSYLENCMKDAKFIYTPINKEPFFVKHKVDMIYLGSMSEQYQAVIIEKLSKYKDILKKRIEEEVIVLFTGMAIEIVGNYVEEDNKKIDCLGLFDVYFERDKKNRHNSLFIGEFNDIKIVGNKSQFTFMYGNNKHPFIKACKGCIGMNPDIIYDGIHYKNFFATSLLGPILILNPYFTSYLIKLKNKNFKLAYQEDLIESYNRRIKLLENRSSYIL